MQVIGNTPLIKLEHLTGPGDAEVWVKWEGANPTGSMKDRMALAMIEGAEASGELKPGGRVVDYTGGSTGSSLAMVCAIRGYKALFVTSDAFAESKLNTMRAFGAELDIIPSENRMITAELMQEAQRRVRVLAQEPNTYWTDQFNNAHNHAGYHAMAREIVRDLGGAPDEFVTGVGTGGSFCGNAEVLRRLGTKCIAVEPANSRPLAQAMHSLGRSIGVPPMKGEKPGSHRLEGMGAGFVPGAFNFDLADDLASCMDEDAYTTARDLARREGIFGGISSGANVWVALQRARKLGAGKRVVTIIVDSGLKYLEGDLYC